MGIIFICPDHGVVIRGPTTESSCPICGKPLVSQEEEIANDPRAPRVMSGRGFDP